MEENRIEKLINIPNLQSLLINSNFTNSDNVKIYNFLIGNEYYKSYEYTLIDNLFKYMVEVNLWDAYIALRYFDYLYFGGWEYECLIIRSLLLNNKIELTGKFCLENNLTLNGLSYFKDDAIWHGIDYSNEPVPEFPFEWTIVYHSVNKRYYEKKDRMIDLSSIDGGYIVKNKNTSLD